MSKQVEQLALIQRQLHFYRGSEFQVFLEENIVGRAKALRQKADSVNFYTTEGQTEAILCLALAKELEAISGNLLSNLEQLEKMMQDNMSKEKVDKNPFSVTNMR